MSSSSSSALARLGAALAVSAGLHASLALGLEALPWGVREAAPQRFDRGAARLNVAVQPAPATLAQASAPSPAAPRQRAATTGAPPVAPSEAPPDRYFLSSELDVRPAAQGHVQPAYPNDAYLRDISGRVVVRLYVNESGVVDKAVTVLAEPPGYFEEAVERAFLATRFTPGMKRGRPVKTQMVIEVRYDSPKPLAEPAAAK